jgi:hypothetical protein
MRTTIDKTQAGTVRVRIDELALEGFPPGDRFRIAEGIRRELARLIAERGLGRLRQAPGGKPAVDSGSLRIAQGANAQAIGIQVAQSVHRGLTGGHGKR